MAKKNYLKPERRELLDRLVAEGMSLRQMQAKHGFNQLTVKRYYPDYRNRATANRKDWFDIPEETRQLVHQMADERAPLSAIKEVSGLTETQVLYLEPNAAWTRKEASEYALLFQNRKNNSLRGGKS